MVDETNDLKKRLESVEKDVKLLEGTEQELKEENLILKNQIKEILSKMETAADKIKYFKDMKKELKAFFSVKGFSVILNSNSLFKKFFLLSCFIALFVSCMTLVDKNWKGYLANDVVTQIRSKDEQTLSFPAITFCLAEIRMSGKSILEAEFKSLSLNGTIEFCAFESFNNNCTFEDFQHIRMYTGPVYNSYLDCYKYNGGRNDSGHETKILEATKVGLFSGLTIAFNVPKNYYLSYYVGDNNVKPIWSEINHSIGPNNGTAVLIVIKKTVDIKLPKPFSDCIETINSDTSDIVREILEENVAYRQKDCRERCINNYLDKNAIAQNISIREVYTGLIFDYSGNCSHLCPMECYSTSFETSKSEITYSDGRLTMNFFYSERKYTEILHTIKTTNTDFIANTGGVLGLFLEISFISAYRAIICIFDIFFSS